MSEFVFDNDLNINHGEEAVDLSSRMVSAAIEGIERQEVKSYNPRALEVNGEKVFVGSANKVCMMTEFSKHIKKFASKTAEIVGQVKLYAIWGSGILSFTVCGSYHDSTNNYKELILLTPETTIIEIQDVISKFRGENPGLSFGCIFVDDIITEKSFGIEDLEAITSYVRQDTEFSSIIEFAEAFKTEPVTECRKIFKDGPAKKRKRSRYDLRKKQ